MAPHLLLPSTYLLTDMALGTSAFRLTTHAPTGLSNANTALSGSIVKACEGNISKWPTVTGSPLTHFGQIASRLANRLVTPPSTWLTALNQSSLLTSYFPPSSSQTSPLDSTQPTYSQSEHVSSKSVRRPCRHTHQHPLKSLQVCAAIRAHL